MNKKTNILFPWIQKGITFISKKSSQKKKFTIGISLPIDAPFTHATKNSFIDTLRNSDDTKYEFVVYNADNDQNKMVDQTEQIVKQNVDLLFSIDAACSLLAKEVVATSNKHIPIVFGGVKEPATIGLIKSEQASGNNLTGVTGISLPFEERIKTLLHFRPSTKKVLIPYCPNTYFVRKDQQKLETLFNAQKIEVAGLCINHPSELRQKISSFLKKHENPDVIMTLRDNITSTKAETLTQLCNKHGLTFFTWHLDNINTGAALGIVSNDYNFGIQSALLAQRILEKNQQPSEIPVTCLMNNFEYLVINSKTMRQQGITVNPSFFKNMHVI